MDQNKITTETRELINSLEKIKDWIIKNSEKKEYVKENGKSSL